MIDYTLPLDQLPDPLPIEPLRKPFDVTITPPGSKSITCRAYVLAALAKGQSRIIRPLRALDTDLLLNALCTLGAEAKWVMGDGHDGEDVLITGVNGRFPRGGAVNLGDGGAPTRFMIAAACLAAEPVVVDGSPRMRERPIAEGVEMLRQLGAKIEYVEAEGRLPVRVVPSRVGGTVEVSEAQSSQFVSAVMLISPFLRKRTRVSIKGGVPSISYIELTEAILREWGYWDEGFLFRRRVRRRRFAVPSDASSAVYFFLAAAINANSRTVIPDFRPIGMYQPDWFVRGVFLSRELHFKTANAIMVGPDHVKPFQLDCENSPDAALALGVYAAMANAAWSSKERASQMELGEPFRGLPVGRTSRMTGLRTLRVKETDRITALANELRKVGCQVETGEDWIEITPPVQSALDHAGSDRREDPDLRPADGQSGSSSPMTRSSEPLVPGGSLDPASKDSKHTNSIVIETYNDHRMAMSFAILGLVRPGISIRNPACVAKSYPTFWKDFAKLYQ